MGPPRGGQTINPPGGGGGGGGSAPRVWVWSKIRPGRHGGKVRNTKFHQREYVSIRAQGGAIFFKFWVNVSGAPLWAGLPAAPGRLWLGTPQVCLTMNAPGGPAEEPSRTVAEEPSRTVAVKGISNAFNASPPTFSAFLAPRPPSPEVGQLSDALRNKASFLARFPEGAPRSGPRVGCHRRGVAGAGSARGPRAARAKLLAAGFSPLWASRAGAR